MIIGPVFTREAVTTPRRLRHYLFRTVYATALLILMCTAWLVLTGTQIIRNVGDMARFGSILFTILALVQMALVVFLSALGSASAVSLEKDRRTLLLLLLTRLSNNELVVGKLLASLLNVLAMVTAALPLFVLATLFGGVSYVQVARVFAVTLATALAAGSLGSTLALWREKTFQALSMTALAVFIWVGLWESVYAAAGGMDLLGIPAGRLAEACSPLRAILAAAAPKIETGRFLVDVVSDHVGLFLAVALMLSAALNLVAILRIRVWYPSREVRPGQEDQAAAASIWGAEYDSARNIGATADLEGPAASRPDGADAAELARAGHVDAVGRARRTKGTSRRVWDNAILWRETCTWAYGRKVLVIRVVYLLLFALAAAALHGMISAEGISAGDLGSIIPAAAKPLAPFFLVSLVIVNALAVNSITNERDGQSLDLLLVTDLTAKEFVLGKLGGILWVTKEMVLLPMALAVYLWYSGGLQFERLIFVLAGLAVMNVFVGMLGIHCGMTYANSRTAIGVSLGTVFFLFLGVITCLVLMISFSGSFQTQLTPFLIFILGGGLSLYVCLGARNPSPAIGAASLLLPFATFYAITSFLLDYPLTVFLVTTATYGFTTAAMMIPAIGEFDIAMGRTKTPGED